jgi:hypothetical protein
VFVAPATLGFSYTNPKLVAALVAALVAWRTKSVSSIAAAWLRCGSPVGVARLGGGRRCRHAHLGAADFR